MLSLSCDIRDCFGYNSLYSWKGYHLGNRHRFYRPHRVNQTCSTQLSRERVDDVDVAADRDQFIDHFKSLPYEMRLKCLTHCTFHSLLNTELWLKEVDTRHCDKLMKECHVTRPKCAWTLDIMDLSTFHTPVSLDFRPFSSFPESMTATLRTGKYNQTDDALYVRYGATNRYPCFYYRECQKSLESSVKDIDRLPDSNCRWKNLLTFLQVGQSCLPLSSYSSRSYNHNSFSKTVTAQNGFYNTKRVGHSKESYLKPITLNPGVYYWEHIDYNWEEAVEVMIREDDSRNRCFVDHSPLIPGTSDLDFYKRYRCASLLYRRVVHPVLEADDLFSTICRFKDGRVTVDGYYKHLYLTFDRSADLNSSSKLLEKEQVVYRHIFTPTSDVSVYKCIDKDTLRNVFYYRVGLPANSRIFSIDRNSSTVRINFYVKYNDTTGHDKAVICSPHLRFLTSPDNDCYAFLHWSYYNVLENYDKAEEIFNLLFTPNVGSTNSKNTQH